MIQNAEYRKLILGWIQRYKEIKNNFMKKKVYNLEKMKRRLPPIGILNLKTAFKFYDINNKGYFTLEDFKKKAADTFNEEELEKIFKEGNKANNGKMTFQEYVKTIVSTNSRYSVSDEILDEIAQKYLTPRK